MVRYIAILQVLGSSFVPVKPIWFCHHRLLDFSLYEFPQGGYVSRDGALWICDVADIAYRWAITYLNHMVLLFGAGSSTCLGSEFKLVSLFSL